MPMRLRSLIKPAGNSGSTSTGMAQLNRDHTVSTLKQLRVTPWLVGVACIACLVSLPILTITSYIFAPASDIWQHLIDTVLQTYVSNSLILMVGVGTISVILGVSTAWLISMCEFPGRDTLEWTLLLPLAMPAYIIAFTYAGLLDPAGLVQSFIRSRLELQYGEYWFPEVRSLPGAVILLSLVLYPYVYMLTRAAFLAQSICVLEVSRTLGCGPWRSFFSIALPLARPAIAGGLTLVSMEALADYGTVQFFGVSTFTTGIFRTWFGLGDPQAAAHLATMLMTFILLLIVIERISRRRARYHHTSNKYSSLPRYPLRRAAGAWALIFCCLPLVFGFIIPVTQLSVWALANIAHALQPEFLLLVWNTFWLAGITAIIATCIATYLGYAQRIQPKLSISMLVRLSGIGYAVPGTVIAVAVMIISGWFDKSIINLLKQCCNVNPGLLLSGTFIALVFTYLVRFLSVSLHSVEAGLTKIRPSMDNAAQALGFSPSKVIRTVHFPLLRGTLLTAGLLVFVDVLKELPATLVMRPFNFNTLAVRAYELASDERLAEAATAGLAIVLVGIIPVIFLNKSIRQSRPGQQEAEQ